MTTLSFVDYGIASASLGEKSCLPDIHVNSYIRASISVSKRIGGEDARFIGKGMVSTLLPYRITDGYDRGRAEKIYKAAILENECLRAVFLPELGGRLWSLFDKKRDRELLYRNDVFQPANLALTNAWFSGGVEWNVGIKGHNPLTTSPLFACECKNADGDGVLKMYGYERIRGVSYCLLASLSGEELVVKVRIENKSDEDKYMYWWSNIAVPEKSGTRVIVPASEAFYCAYTDGGYFLDKSSLPEIEGKEITYPETSSRSRDFFFNIQGKEKWICAVDGQGEGLMQRSDPILKGRKLFVWGNHTGGRHWNEWLSDKAGPYVEIQAGLLKTQLEHFVMEKRSVIEWREAYGYVKLDGSRGFGEWNEAVLEAGEVAVNRFLKGYGDLNTVSEQEPAVFGSGWGALEEIIRGERLSEDCNYPISSITAAQKEWLDLINGTPLPNKDPFLPISGYVVGEKWLALMKKYPADNWYYYNHLGVMQYANGDYDGAKASFENSIKATPNAWAYRNLAMLKGNAMGEKGVSSLMEKALLLKPDYLPLAAECAVKLMDDGKYEEWIVIYDKLPEMLQKSGRLRMLTGACLVKLGKEDAAEQYINENLVVYDIKEGEYSLSAIWQELYARKIAKKRGCDIADVSEKEVFDAYPLPRSLDFRMH